MDNIQSYAVVSVGGYDSTQNHLNLDGNFPGRATDLLNYEIGLNGGYRRINGYRPFDVDFVKVDDTNAEGKILLTALWRDSDEIDHLFVARKQKSGNTYKIYRYVDGVGFVAETHPTRDTVDGIYQVTKLRYETVNFGGESFLVVVDGVNPAMVYDGTTWFELTSAGTGTELSPGGNQITDRPNAVRLYKGHVFLARDSEYKEIVCHSAPQDIYNWTAAAGAGQLPTGFKTVQIRAFRDILYVWGYDRITSVAVDGTTFVLKDISTTIGTVAPDSVVEVSGDLYFFAADGIRPISGTSKIGDVQMAIVSKPIQYYTSRLLAAYDLEYLDAVVIRGKSQFRYFISEPDGEGEGVGILGGLRTADNETGWEFSRLQGIRTSCATSGFYKGKEVVVHGDFDGSVYIQETGNSFNGENITSIYATPYLTINGDPKITKMARTISTFYRLEGSLDINIELDFDWGMQNILTPATYSQSFVTNVSYYNDGTTYNDGATYSGLVRAPVLELPVEGSFRSVQIIYSSSDTNPPHSIQGFVIEYTPQARR